MWSTKLLLYSWQILFSLWGVKNLYYNCDKYSHANTIVRKRQRLLVFSRLSKVLIFHHREMSVLKMTHSFHHFGNKVEFSLSGYIMTLNGLRWSIMDLILWSLTPPHDFKAVYVFEYRLKLAASLGPFQVSLKRSCSFSFVVSFTYFSGSPSSFFKTWCLLEANSSLLRQYYLSKQRN